MKSSFPKCVKRNLNKWDSNVYIYLHIYEELFQNNLRSLNLALTLGTYFLEWRLMSFEKELFIYEKLFSKT